MTLIVETPPGRSSERAYIFGVLLGEFLGLDWKHVPSGRRDVRISLAGESGAVVLPDTLFSLSDREWLDPSSVPGGPLGRWSSEELANDVDLVASDVPILFGGSPGAETGNEDIVLALDIFGSAFFMLTRYEEVAAPVFDARERFPATASLAYRAGFLDRPIVDEYVEILWAALLRVWPGLQRKGRQGCIRVTCDVDTPFDPAMRSLGALARIATGDLLKRRDISLSLQRFRRYYGYRSGNYDADPFHTFDWYMSVCDRAGLKAAFYFIPDRSDPRMDGVFEIFNPRIVALIARLHTAGHEIGAHGSYHTFRDPRQVVRERERLIAAAGKTGRTIELTGNRQHYLRWDSRETADHLDAAGYHYDTTGGFADMPGFRYGTAKPFAMWSWRKGRPLKIRQRPLIVMECSVIADAYLGLGYTPEGYDMMSRLKSRALQYGGDFTLLWHNSYFMDENDKIWFSSLIGGR